MKDASSAPVTHHGTILETVGAHEVIDCAACGYAHVRPMPDVADLKKLYSEKFYGEDKTNYLLHMEQDLPWWNMVYAERLETIEKLLGPAAGRRILDVGCSYGFFLKAAESRGWQTQGIELGRQAANYAAAHGVSVRNEDVQDVDWKALGTFDAIYMSFVLEHLPNPAEILNRVKTALAPGGIFCAEVPNDFNPFQKIVREGLGAPPYWVAPDHHLNYFTPDSLKRLFASAGLPHVAVDGTFPMELFLLMGDNYIGNDPLGRKLHGKRKHLEALLHRGGLNELKRELYRFLLDKNIGREVVLYSRKPKS